jgi:hypothetical protein
LITIFSSRFSKHRSVVCSKTENNAIFKWPNFHF